MKEMKICVKNSICFGVYYQHKTIGFARVLTDGVALAWLFDVFILEEHKGKGLGKKLIEFILAHPDLKNIKRWMLTTEDAQGLYEPFGFKKPEHVEWLMEYKPKQDTSSD